MSLPEKVGTGGGTGQALRGEAVWDLAAKYNTVHASSSVPQTISRGRVCMDSYPFPLASEIPGSVPTAAVCSCV